MGSKHGSNRLLSCLAMVVMVVCGVTKADIESDKKECTDKLVGLATCLTYVGGEASAPPVPPKDCCTGLKQVLTNSMVCLCILVKDHNDPSLKLKINDTLALGLPDACHTPTNISNCVGKSYLLPRAGSSPFAVCSSKRDWLNLVDCLKTTHVLCSGLLKLPPGSPDAKVFEDYAKRFKSNTTTIALPGNATNSNSTASDGGRRNTHLGLNIVGLVFIMVMLHFTVSSEFDNYQ